MRKLVVCGCLALLAWACAEEQPPAACDQCTAKEVCWYSHDLCVPRPDFDGNCPEGYEYKPCASASCPDCKDCQEGCLPRDLLGLAGASG